MVEEASGARREEARVALGGEKLATQQKVIRRRREEARLAMESEYQRVRRETRERARDMTAARERAAVETKAATAAKNEAEKARAAAERSARETAELADIAEQRSRATEAAATTDKLKQTPKTKLSSFHTIKTDMAKAVRDQGLSLSKIATLSREHGGGESIVAGSSRWWIVAVSFVLVLAAGGGLFAWWWFAGQQTPSAPPTPSFVSSIMRADQDRAIEIDGITTSAIGEALEAATETGTTTTGLSNLYLTRRGEILPFSNFQQVLGLDLPDNLSRYLRDNFIFGLYNSGDTSSRFLVLQTNFFDQAWAAMLEWERYMTGNLGDLLKTQNDNNGRWHDRIIRNKDTRLEQNSAGDTVLVYGFVDDKTILIARNEDTFIKVFERLIDQT